MTTDAGTAPAAADVYRLTITVPGSGRTLTMESPEWAELTEGWQLGGFVALEELDQFGSLFTADRLTVTHPDGTPEFITLRSALTQPTSYGYSRVFLKIRSAFGPRRPLSAEPRSDAHDPEDTPWPVLDHEEWRRSVGAVDPAPAGREETPAMPEP